MWNLSGPLGTIACQATNLSIGMCWRDKPKIYMHTKNISVRAVRQFSGCVTLFSHFQFFESVCSTYEKAGKVTEGLNL